MELERSEKEIDDCLNKADHWVDKGTRVPGMSYEQGVADALHWAIGDTDDNPMDDDLFNIEDEDEEE